MDILIFSDNPKLKKIFARLEKSKELNIQLLPLKEMKKTISGIKKHTLLYLDLASCAAKQLNSVLNLLAKAKNISFGIIDPQEISKDKALLFFNGACDYLGREQCKMGIQPNRLGRVLSFSQTAGVSQQTAPKIQPAAVSQINTVPARDWGMVEPGGEYLFYMMFIELDGYQDLHARVGEAAVERLLSSFQKAAEKYLAGQKGRLWIWNDFGGFFLFPFFDRPEGIISSCMRLMLSRRILSIEQCEQKVLLSYRIVLQQGSTVFRERGRTGRIISDSVNSLSHMGTKFARPGNFYLTEDLLNKTKSDLANCFLKAGNFEGTELFKMRLPVRY
jgi:hypothetical protein